MDQANLYNLLNPSIPIFEGSNRVVIRGLNGIPGTICPSDANRARTRVFHGTANNNYMSSVPNTSYVGSSGAFNSWSDSNDRRSGGFFHIDPAPASRMGSMRDGTSNIVAVSERSARISTWGSWLGAQHSTTQQATIGPSPDHDIACCQDHWLYFAVFPITTDVSRVGGTPQQLHLRASSDHLGGAHCLMADGSVRFISESINHILDQTGNDTASYNPTAGAGCLWRNDGGCGDGASPGGAFLDKPLLMTRMGLWQRLHHQADGLAVGDY